MMLVQSAAGRQTHSDALQDAVSPVFRRSVPKQWRIRLVSCAAAGSSFPWNRRGCGAGPEGEC